MNFKKTLTAFIIIGIVGTLCHFVYKWSGENTLVGLLAPVNESIFEHQKLMFFPSVLYFAIEYFCFGKDIKNYISASVMGIFSGIAFVVSFFYLYSGILGYSVDIVNVLLYFAGVAVMLIVRNILIKNGVFGSAAARRVALVSVLVSAVLFMVWTAYPPKISFFIPEAR